MLCEVPTGLAVLTDKYKKPIKARRVVGAQVASEGAYNMLMNTGHNGVLTVQHLTEDPRDLARRSHNV